MRGEGRGERIVIGDVPGIPPVFSWCAGVRFVHPFYDSNRIYGAESGLFL